GEGLESTPSSASQEKGWNRHLPPLRRRRAGIDAFLRFAGEGLSWTLGGTLKKVPEEPAPAKAGADEGARAQRSVCLVLPWSPEWRVREPLPGRTARPCAAASE